MYARVLGQLQAAKGKWPAVSAATGISRSTIAKIARREVCDPGVSLIERLDRYFDACPRDPPPTTRATEER